MRGTESEAEFLTGVVIKETSSWLIWSRNCSTQVIICQFSRDLVWAACEEGNEFIGISFVGIVIYGRVLSEGH